MDKNKEKIPKKEEISINLQKYSPFRDLYVNEETGLVKDSKKFVYYQKFVQWITDVILNGVFVWFVLFAIGKQPLHWIPILADGLAVWFIVKTITKAWNGYVEGKIKIKRG